MPTEFNTFSALGDGNCAYNAVSALLFYHLKYEDLLNNIEPIHYRHWYDLLYGLLGPQPEGSTAISLKSDLTTLNALFDTLAKTFEQATSPETGLPLYDWEEIQRQFAAKLRYQVTSGINSAELKDDIEAELNLDLDYLMQSPHLNALPQTMRQTVFSGMPYMTQQCQTLLQDNNLSIEQRKTQLKHWFWETGFSYYLAYIQRNGIYAGSLELMVISKLLGVGVKYHAQLPNVPPEYQNTLEVFHGFNKIDDDKKDPTKTYLRIWHHNNHWDALFPDTPPALRIVQNQYSLNKPAPLPAPTAPEIQQPLPTANVQKIQQQRLINQASSNFFEAFWLVYYGFHLLIGPVLVAAGLIPLLAKFAPTYFAYIASGLIGTISVGLGPVLTLILSGATLLGLTQLLFEPLVNRLCPQPPQSANEVFNSLVLDEGQAHELKPAQEWPITAQQSYTLGRAAQQSTLVWAFNAFNLKLDRSYYLGFIEAQANSPDRLNLAPQAMPSNSLAY
jgi:hypothetical protein